MCLALSSVIIVSFHKFSFPVLLKRKFLAKPRYATFQKNVAYHCIFLLSNTEELQLQCTEYLVLAYFAHLEHGTPTFFPGHFFLRQKCLRVQTESFFLGLHTFPLRRKKSAATTKIPSVRHFQDLKSILGGRYREKSAPQADFFFWGWEFLFFPPPENLIFGLFAYHPDQWCTKFWLLT